MRKQLLTSAAVLALSAGAAFASDLPTHKAPPPPPPPPVFSWTGCYVGLHAGGDFGNSTWRSSSYSWGDVGMGTSGAIGGGQVGCNYQVQNFVIGAELEIWGSSLTGSTTRTTDAEGVETYGFKTRSDFAGDLALRGGYAIDRTLLFGKVGIAEARYQFTNTFSFDPSFPDRGSATYTGLLLGLGVEYALDLHWTVKGEYDYINYGSRNVGMYYGAGVLDYTPSIRNTENILKVGANYKF